MRRTLLGGGMGSGWPSFHTRNRLVCSFDVHLRGENFPPTTSTTCHCPDLDVARRNQSRLDTEILDNSADNQEPCNLRLEPALEEKEKERPTPQNKLGQRR